MTYAIELLEKEKRQLETILNSWEVNHYPDARKERDNRLKDINDALEKLRKWKNTILMPQTKIRAADFVAVENI